MEVKPGYKLTEVGVIPEDWEVKPFQSLAHIERGKFTARPRNDPKYYGGEIPFIQTGDVTNSSGWIKTYSQTLNQEGLKVSKLFPRGTLFFTIAANIGDVGFAGFDTACPDSLVAITPVNGINRRWLVHELRMRKPSFEKLASHNAQLNINLEKLRPYLLPVPTPAEQEAIAEALSDADALIESLEQLLAKRRQLKQGAMRELLTGKKRLPGFSGKWEQTTLGKMGNCLRGVSYNPTADLSPFDTDSTVRLLRSNNVQEAGVVFADMQFVNCVRVSAEQRLRARDILICMANGSRDLVGKAGRFSADDGYTYTFGAFMGCFRPDGKTADQDFVFAIFQTEAYRTHIGILLAGSSINNLTPGSVEALSIAVPPTRAEQAAIAAILSDMDGEIAALEAKLAKARSIKQGMMQELLTGRIRLV